jgi:hypothetical protein
MCFKHQRLFKSHLLINISKLEHFLPSCFFPTIVYNFCFDLLLVVEEFNERILLSKSVVVLEKLCAMNPNFQNTISVQVIIVFGLWRHVDKLGGQDKLTSFLIVFVIQDKGMGNEIFRFYQSHKRDAFGFSEEIGGSNVFVESFKD